MKKYITLITVCFLIFLLFLFIGLFIRSQKINIENEYRLEKLENESQFYLNLNYKLLEDVGYQYEDEGKSLNDSIILKSEIGEELTLKELSKGKTVLVFRYSQIHCQVCVDKEIKALNELAKIIGSDNIVFIASYSSLRDLMLFKKINQIQFKIYNINEYGLGLGLERLSTPYYFILDDRNLASLIYVPVKEFEQLSKSYFSVVQKRFFEK